MEAAIVNWMRGTTMPAAPGTIYLSLHTADPTDAGGVGEVSGGGYVRMPVTLDAPTDGVTSNSANVEWAAASGSWGTVTHVAIHDHLTAGNMIASQALSASKTVPSGDIFRIAAGALDLTVS